MTIVYVSVDGNNRLTFVTDNYCIDSAVKRVKTWLHHDYYPQYKNRNSVLDIPPDSDRVSVYGYNPDATVLLVGVDDTAY